MVELASLSLLLQQWWKVEFSGRSTLRSEQPKKTTEPYPTPRGIFEVVGPSVRRQLGQLEGEGRGRRQLIPIPHIYNWEEDEKKILFVMMSEEDPPRKLDSGLFLTSLAPQAVFWFIIQGFFPPLLLLPPLPHSSPKKKEVEGMGEKSDTSLDWNCLPLLFLLLLFLLVRILFFKAKDLGGKKEGGCEMSGSGGRRRFTPRTFPPPTNPLTTTTTENRLQFS